VIVRVENDVCVQVLSPGPLKGKYVFYPNSVRRDLPLQFSKPELPFAMDRPFEGRDVTDIMGIVGVK
jgi:hypothetical protein